MHIKTFRVSNFRRLKDVRIDLEAESSIFVGANNSGKTSATNIFKLFLGRDSARGHFAVHDFSADCWAQFNLIDDVESAGASNLPVITLDLWFEVEEENAYCVIDLLPTLDWPGDPVGVRCVYAPKDAKSLIENYQAARAQASARTRDGSAYNPWPQNLTDYLSKRLCDEYQVDYFGLDFSEADENLKFSEDYEPFPLTGNRASSARVVESLIRVDFLDAQRYLSDSESKGRAEDLSKRLSRYYARNLNKPDEDFKALSVLTQSEADINAHFAEEFSPLLDTISEMSYPGVANPKLVIKTSLNAEGLLSGNARVHYELPGLHGKGMTLPDQYNGLGFKNLIYMVIEVLDFDNVWASTESDRSPVHLVMVEEPESHLHAQLQQVFIRKIHEIIPRMAGYQTQLVITTHSAHVIYESDFTPIRYFRRTSPPDSSPYTDVRNLSRFCNEEEKPTRDFLLQYFKLTHCDLFFADGAILVEGNVERLLIPLMIKEVAKDLEGSHLTILEVGGAFAHKFKGLIEFLDIPTLIITDLDSVLPPLNSDIDASDASPDDEAADKEDEVAEANGRACIYDTPDAVTSNPTLRTWAPKLSTVTELLATDAGTKVPAVSDGCSARVRIAYQTLQPCTWKAESATVAGRTLEESLALQNLDWCQDLANRDLGLRVVTRSSQLTLQQVREKLYERVKTFDKTKFALALIGKDRSSWTVPAYIVEGLCWLDEELSGERSPSTDAAIVVLDEQSDEDDS